jgi:hypothetical protein
VLSDDAALRVVLGALSGFLYDLAQEALDRAAEELFKEELARYRSIVQSVLSEKHTYDPEAVKKLFSRVEPAAWRSESFSEWVEEAYGLEREGRELALALAQAERLADEQFYRLLDRAAEWSDRVAEAVEDLMNLELPVEVKGYAVVLRDLFISLKKACQWGVLHPALAATLHLLDSKARELVGRGVVWGSLNSFTNVINSATSALHALIEYVQGRFIGRAILLARDREFGKELAGTFFATIEKMLDEGLYVIPGDLIPTYIAVTDSEVVMRLGSAAGPRRPHRHGERCA